MVLLAGGAAGAVEPGAKPKNPADAALAEALFNEARDLLRDKKYTAACPKFAESYRLDPALGALLNLASCHELEGRVATAWGEYRDAEAQALRTNDRKREKFAREHADALEPRLPKLVLTMNDPPEGLELSRDGATLGTASLGTALPVDPGERALSATAPGKKPWRKTFVAREGQRYRFAIPALQDAPHEEPKAPPVESGAPAPAGSPKDTADDGGSRGRFLAGVIVGAVGVAGLAAGGVFVGLTASKKSAADDECVGTTPDGSRACVPEAFANVEAAKDFANAANIALGAGGALVIAGGILILTSGGSGPTKKESAASPAKVSVLPAMGPAGGGVVARMRF